MQTKTHKSFDITKPIEELSEVEALVLVNRWVKCKNYFYHDDRDILYAIKDQKIDSWLKSGELKVNKIIQRESPTIDLIKTELANKGKNIQWQAHHFDPHYRDYMTDSENQYQQLIYDLTSGIDLYVDYPEDIYQRWREDLQPEIEAYKKAKDEYDIEFARRKPLIAKYNQDLAVHRDREKAAAKVWAKENNVKIARSNSGKSLKKDWLKRLKQQGFKYSVNPPQNPFSQKLSVPQRVKYPDKNYPVNFENYVPGSIAEIEEALNWAQTFVSLPEIWEINDDFVCIELDFNLEELKLKELVTKVLEIFQDIVDKKLTEPQEIYDKLTNYPLNYENAIGMNNYYDFRNKIESHYDFGKWHEINFSPTGYWLVEFKSTINPGITFHSPYNKVQSACSEPLNVPVENSSQAKYGREITGKERVNYPIRELIKLLGYSIYNFPWELERYSKPARGRFCSYSDWEDEDIENEDWCQ